MSTLGENRTPGYIHSHGELSSEAQVLANRPNCVRVRVFNRDVPWVRCIRVWTSNFNVLWIWCIWIWTFNFYIFLIRYIRVWIFSLCMLLVWYIGVGNFYFYLFWTICSSDADFKYRRAGDASSNSTSVVGENPYEPPYKETIIFNRYTWLFKFKTCHIMHYNV